MAWIYNLLDDDTTLQLNDGTNYKIHQGGFFAPPPDRRMAFGGRSLFRHGADLLERVYENRTVTLRIQILGATQDGLITNINAIHSLLERGAEYATKGLNSQLKLRRQWNNATNTTDFLVLEGVLEVPEGTAIHVVNTRIVEATLTLLCKPFAEGAAITVRNFVADPSFEIAGTALADWTENISATGTTSRSTAQKKYGAASLLCNMTNSGASGQVVERTQVLTDVDAGEVWSFAAWVYFTALSNCKAVMELLYNDGGATSVTVERTTVSAAFVQLTLANQTAPAGATQVTIKVRLQSTAASATGTCYWDGVLAVQAAALPAIWVSGEAVRNHFDDDGQAHINYVDIYDVPGDVPALLQVRLAEDQTLTEEWMGARHAGRADDTGLWQEGEASSQTAINIPANWNTNEATIANASRSDGNYQETYIVRINATGNSVLAAGTYFRHEWTLSSPPTGQYRVLACVAWDETTPWAVGAPTALDFSFGMSWGYGAVTLLNDTAPVTTSFVSLPSGLASAVFVILDLGVITIPPILTPDGRTAPNLVLKIFERWTAAGGNPTFDDGTSFAKWLIDFVMLMPIDMGSGYVDKTSATNVLLLDSRSALKGLYILNTSDVVQSFPTNQLGRPPEAHPEGTRVYILAEDGNSHTIADTWRTTVTVVPRFLLVREA